MELILDNNLLSVPKFTENLYCICLSIPQSIFKQMQYRFAVNFGTFSRYAGV